MPVVHPVPAGRGSRAGWLAWSVWAALTLGVLLFVWRYALPLPYFDDWDWVPQTIGHEPLTLAWLWSLHDEHRMLLPRLILLGLGTVAGHDPHAVMFFLAVLMAGVSAGLMLAARAVRGATRLVDAVFPLLLQHLGLGLTLVWGTALLLVMPVALALVSLLLVVRCRGPLSPRRAAGITACLLAAGVCSAACLPHLLLMAGWLAMGAVWSSIATDPAPLQPQATRARAGAFLAMAGLLVALVAAYFVGFHTAQQRGAWPGVAASLRTTLEFLACGLGPGAKEAWFVIGPMVAAAAGWAAWQLIAVTLRQPRERWRASGLLALLAAEVALAVSIGCSRAYLGPGAGFADRYTPLSAALLCVCFFQWLLYAPPVLARRAPQVLLIVLCILLPVNVRKGWHVVTDLDGLMQCMWSDLRDGMPSDTAATRYGERVAHGSFAVCAQRLQMLRDARFGPFREPTGSAASKFTTALLAEIANLMQIPASRPLAIGEEIRQPFRVACRGLLRRIDLHPGCKLRSGESERLRWTLARTPANGEPSVCAMGEIDLAQPPGDGFFRLRFPPLPVSAGEALALTLAADPQGTSAASARPASLGYFSGSPCAEIVRAGCTQAASGCLKGYAFIETER